MRGDVANVADPDVAPDGGDGVGEGEDVLAIPSGGVGESAAPEQILGPEDYEAVEAHECGRGAADGRACVETPL
jgi:hypothetical protein